MKKITVFLLLSMVIVFSAEAHKYKNGHNNAGITISIQTFYDDLSPYGDWVYTSDYGYVWRPYFEYPDAFRPYSSGGHWVNTDYGWTWLSDYRWGWATFHYGRWAFDNYLGWMWVPGYEWAPAWVTWGNYGDYYGWAPMGPNVYAYSTSEWYAPDPWWTFVPRHRFCASNWNTYIYDRPVHVTNITHITNVYVNNHNTNNSWYYGPRVSDVERYTNNRVIRMDVVDSESADNAGIRNDRLNVYRPGVDNRRKDARPVEYRNAEQARNKTRVQQTSARTNDPGTNRTRENRQVASTSALNTDSRNKPANLNTRVEPRADTQTLNTRATEVKKDSKTAPRTTANSSTRTTPANRESTVDARTTQRHSTSVTSAPASARAKKETSDRQRMSAADERKSPAASPARVENSESRQARTTSTTRENINQSASGTTKNRQSTSAAPASDQKSRNVSPEVRSRSDKTETKQSVKEEIRQAGSRKPSPTNERSSSAKPTRR